MKEQCRNCTFLNGQFAQECEMCGEPLTGAAKDSARKSLFDNKHGSGSAAASRYDRKDTFF